MKNEQVRKHLPSMFPLIKNETLGFKNDRSILNQDAFVV